MNILSKAVLVGSAILLSGCAVPLVSTGGSRADGTVEMSHEYKGTKKPSINWAETKKRATLRCQAWGYKTANAFGGTSSRCQERNSAGQCLQAAIKRKYQCIGKRS